jgi:hypothetical protein
MIEFIKIKIRQFLCEHKKTSFIKKIVLTKEFKNECLVLDLKQWERCKCCGKIIYSHIKF